MATASNPMDYYIFPLTKEEHKKGGVAHGFKFVKNNESRWILVNDSNYELQTYDRGYTQVVYENKVYMVIKDYIIIDENKRVFVLGTLDTEVDRIESAENTEESTEKTPVEEGSENSEGETTTEEDIEETDVENAEETSVEKQEEPVNENIDN